MKKQRSAQRWIFNSAKPQFLNISILAIMFGLNAFIGVYNTVFARDLVNAAVDGTDFNKVLYYAGLYIGITVVELVTIVVANQLTFKVSNKLVMSMRLSLFRSMMNKNYADVSAYHSGELMNRLTGDIGVVSDAIMSILPNLLYFIVKLVGIFIVLISIDIWFALVFVAGGALVCLASILFKPYTKRLHKESQQSEGKVRSFMQEGLSSLLMIKTFNAQDRMTEGADDLQQENYRIKRKRNIFSLFTSTSMAAAFSFAYVWALCWSSYMLFTRAITYGVLMQIVSLVAQIHTPIQGISNIFPTYFTALASAERIMEIENIPDDETIHTEADIRSVYCGMRSICFEDVTFAYDSETVLEHSSLKVNKGEFVVMEGISGIGKSTLFKLLLSVYKPSEGRIYIDSVSGEYPVDKSMRKLFAYVPQGNFLLSGTLRENIAFVAPDATEEDIMRAAEIACAGDFISELPKGLDSVIAERGAGLSEGQVQRIAIARAILTGAPVLLLDEATSALDEDTEARLLRNLRGLSDVTCIIISHKKAAESICDRVVTIRDKTVTEK